MRFRYLNTIIASKNTINIQKNTITVWSEHLEQNKFFFTVSELNAERNDFFTISIKNSSQIVIEKSTRLEKLFKLKQDDWNFIGECVSKKVEGIFLVNKPDLSDNEEIMRVGIYRSEDAQEIILNGFCESDCISQEELKSLTQKCIDYVMLEFENKALN